MLVNVRESLLNKSMLIESEKDSVCEEIEKGCFEQSRMTAVPDLWSGDITLDDITKSGGAGSRGGKIIGYSKGGKPIYEGHVTGKVKEGPTHPMSKLHSLAGSWTDSADQAKSGDEHHQKRQGERHADMMSHAEKHGIPDHVVEKVKAVHRGSSKAEAKDVKESNAKEAAAKKFRKENPLGDRSAGSAAGKYETKKSVSSAISDLLTKSSEGEEEMNSVKKAFGELSNREQMRKREIRKAEEIANKTVVLGKEPLSKSEKKKKEKKEDDDDDSNGSVEVEVEVKKSDVKMKPAKDEEEKKIEKQQKAEMQGEVEKALDSIIKGGIK